MNKEEISPAAAAKILGLSASWLAHMRALKKGPAFHKRGRSVFYLLHEVQAYKQSTTTGGKSMLVVELKTLTLMPDGKGGHTVTVNGKKHPVKPGAQALLISQ